MRKKKLSKRLLEMLKAGAADVTKGFIGNCNISNAEMNREEHGPHWDESFTNAGCCGSWCYDSKRGLMLLDPETGKQPVHSSYHICAADVKRMVQAVTTKRTFRKDFLTQSRKQENQIKKEAC